MGTVVDMRLFLQSGHSAKYADIVRRSRNRTEIAARGTGGAAILRWPSVLEEVRHPDAQPSGETMQVQDRDISHTTLDS